MPFMKKKYGSQFLKPNALENVYFYFYRCTHNMVRVRVSSHTPLYYPVQYFTVRGHRVGRLLY